MLGGPPVWATGLVLVRERCGVEGSLSKCRAVLSMFDKVTCRSTASSTGQPYLPCTGPQSLAGRASQVALVVKNPPANTGDRCKRLRFNLWVRTIPWRRKWQPTPVFFPGKSHTQGRLAGCSLRGRKESDMPEWLSMAVAGGSLWEAGLSGSSAFPVQLLALSLTCLPFVRGLRGSFSRPPWSHLPKCGTHATNVIFGSALNV